MFWSRLKITANRSRMDQSYVIKKLGENYKLEATPLWKFSHLILGLKKLFIFAVSYWSSYWYSLGHHINISDRRNQMALEFSWIPLPSAPLTKMQKLCDKKNLLHLIFDNFSSSCRILNMVQSQLKITANGSRMDQTHQSYAIQKIRREQHPFESFHILF